MLTTDTVNSNTNGMDIYQNRKYTIVVVEYSCYNIEAVRAEETLLAFVS